MKLTGEQIRKIMADPARIAVRPVTVTAVHERCEHAGHACCGQPKPCSITGWDCESDPATCELRKKTGARNGND